jgi:hypothetical protein
MHALIQSALQVPLSLYLMQKKKVMKKREKIDTKKDYADSQA